MHATVGDRIVVRGHDVGEPERDAEILEVHGADGTPPYLVRWSDDGHVATYVPGPDAHVDHLVGTPPAEDPPAAETDPIRRELRAGISALRADVARLRAAASEGIGLGSELWQMTAVEVGRAARRVDCEAAVIWAQFRGAEAESVDAIRQAIEDATGAVRTLVDEARVQADLGAAEAGDLWDDVTAGIRRLRDDPGMPIDAARAAATDLLTRLRGVADHAMGVALVG